MPPRGPCRRPGQVGIGAKEGESAQEYEARFEKFLAVWNAESGIGGVESFFPTADQPGFDVAIESMAYDFRDR